MALSCSDQSLPISDQSATNHDQLDQSGSMPDECLITAKSKPDPMAASARIGPPSRACQYSRRFSLKRRYPADPKVFIQQERALSTRYGEDCSGALDQSKYTAGRRSGAPAHPRFATEATTTRIRRHIDQQSVRYLSTCATPCLNGAPGSKDPFEWLHIRQLLHEHTPVQVLRPPSTLFHVKHQFCPIIGEHLRP